MFSGKRRPEKTNPGTRNRTEAKQAVNKDLKHRIHYRHHRHIF